MGRTDLYLHSTLGHVKRSRLLILGTTIALRFPNLPWEQQALEREGGGVPQHPLALLPPSSAPPIFLKPQAMKDVVRTVSSLLGPHQDSLSREENGVDTLSSIPSRREVGEETRPAGKVTNHRVPGRQGDELS